MRKSESEIRITPSVLDRLVDLDPNISTEPPKSRSASVLELKQSVRRDLEWLLNTRCFLETDGTELLEMRKSVAFYGLPDVTGLSAKNPAEQKRLAASVEAAIRIFEPRFINLKVTMAEMSDTERQMKFHIEASLAMDPAPEPIAFDTVLEMGSGDFQITAL